MTAAWNEIRIYVGRIREFERRDWIVYLAWVGLVTSLCLASGAFLLIGHLHGARFDGEAPLVPLGAGIFAAAIAVDTIGHRTVYKKALQGAENLVHRVIIVAGIGSCVLLCASYPQRSLTAGPALILTILSFIYSLVDEALHWRRYINGRSDAVEMASHGFILLGHGTMMYGWWMWYFHGYPGVRETLAALGTLF